MRKTYHSGDPIPEPPFENFQDVRKEPCSAEGDWHSWMHDRNFPPALVFCDRCGLVAEIPEGFRETADA